MSTRGLSFAAVLITDMVSQNCPLFGARSIVLPIQILDPKTCFPTVRIII
jgi:hypothetical protein